MGRRAVIANLLMFGILLILVGMTILCIAIGDMAVAVCYSALSYVLWKHGIKPIYKFS